MRFNGSPLRFRIESSLESDYSPDQDLETERRRARAIWPFSFNALRETFFRLNPVQPLQHATHDCVRIPRPAFAQFTEDVIYSHSIDFVKYHPPVLASLMQV